MLVFLRSSINDILEDQTLTIHADSAFSDLNLNSLQFVKLTVACEDEFSIEFQDDDFLLGEYLTIEDFIERILLRMSD